MFFCRLSPLCFREVIHVEEKRYVEGCLRAFLEGNKSLNWIVGVIVSSRVRGEKLKVIFKELVSCADRSRFEEVRKACEDLGLFGARPLF